MIEYIHHNIIISKNLNYWTIKIHKVGDNKHIMFNYRSKSLHSSAVLSQAMSKIEHCNSNNMISSSYKEILTPKRLSSDLRPKQSSMDAIFVDIISGETWRREIISPIIVGDHILLDYNNERLIDEIVSVSHYLSRMRHTLLINIRAANKIFINMTIFDFR